MDAPKKILVVDDDATARIMMRAALRKAGFEVHVAAGGHEALQLFPRERFAMVMLDVDMPGLDGHAVCAELRASAGELLPIVMVTGMDDLESVERAYDAGATGFLPKPIHWALLGHRVRYLLRSHEALLALRAAEARTAAILNAIPDLLFEVDIDGRFVDYHCPRPEMLAVAPEVFLGKQAGEFLPPPAAQACMTALRIAQERGTSSGQQFELRLPHGKCWFELSVASKAHAAGDKPSFIFLSRDITERKQSEERIARLAYLDSLTGLPNRMSFLDRVDREIRRAERGDCRLALLFMDLDGFKAVNDTLGHAAGDRVLQQAADRLREGLRPSDLLARAAGDGGSRGVDADLARLGGDEFTALLLDIDDPHDLLAVAGRIGALMRRPFELDGRALNLSTSIGIAIHPQDGRDATTLLRHADRAMYQAKRVGRDNAQLYGATPSTRTFEYATLDTAWSALAPASP